MGTLLFMFGIGIVMAQLVGGRMKARRAAKRVTPVAPTGRASRQSL
jgi:predicted MFS family arabinose efflux permease